MALAIRSRFDSVLSQAAELDFEHEDNAMVLSIQKVPGRGFYVRLRQAEPPHGGSSGS